jgi:general secretion pathway protein L
MTRSVRWDGADDWQWFDGAALRRGDAAALAMAVGDAPLNVLLATPQAWVGAQALPRVAGRRLRQAVAFAVEDQLAGELEGRHVAVGRRRADGRVEFAVIDCDMLEAALARLRAAGLRPVSLTPLAALLPPDGASVLAEPNWLTVRLAGEASLCGPPPDVLLLLAALHPPALDWRQLPGGPQPPADVAAEVTPVPAHEVLRLAAGGGIDLLQGAFAPPPVAGRWRAWRPALVAAAVWLVLLVAGRVLETHQLAQRNAALREAVNGEFMRLFPEEGRPVSLRAQAQRRLELLERGARGGGALLPLLTVAAGALPAGQALTGLDYGDGRLVLDLKLPDLPAVEALRGALAGRPGVRVELPVAVAQDGVVRTRVVLQMREAP